MSYAFSFLWYGRRRYLAGAMAVAFSAVLVALQFGLLLGSFAVTSMPIDHTRADIWVGPAEVQSADLGRPIPERYLTHIANQPEVERAEPFIEGWSYWSHTNGAYELCIVIGSRLEADALGAVVELAPDLRRLLMEPGAIVLDESERSRLRINGVGDTAEIGGQKVRVVGLVKGIKNLAGPYVLCSLRTARSLLRLQDNQVNYVLARCRGAGQAGAVAQRLRSEIPLSAFTSDEFSRRSRIHWLTKTKMGLALGFAAVLGLLVGAMVTTQTLYAATVASLREFAVLYALGISLWRVTALVLTQSLWIGFGGVLAALPVTYALAWGADRVGAMIELPAWLLAASAIVSMVMAILAGLAALRSLRLIDPAILLR